MIRKFYCDLQLLIALLVISRYRSSVFGGGEGRGQGTYAKPDGRVPRTILGGTHYA